MACESELMAGGSGHRGENVILFPQFFKIRIRPSLAARVRLLLLEHVEYFVRLGIRKRL